MSGIKTPVGGGNASQGKPDGVSGSPEAGGGGNIDGRSAGGESGGGAYPNPHTGREPGNSGFLGHGGQTDIAYHGGGQAGGEGGDAPNAVAASESSDGNESGSAPWPAPEHPPRPAGGGGQAFQVVETDGVAAAEATGKVGTDAPDERGQESPGAG